MHASTVLQKVLHSVIPQFDQRNARTLFLAIEALLTGRRLTLMELARHWPGALRVRAPLKRLDRFLSNREVHAQRSHCYAAAIAWLIRSPRPVLIVDWSELKSDGRWHLLRAGVVAWGRTLTVYEEVHPEARKNNPQVEAAFLQRLQTLLPKQVCPILITDAGFRVPWFRAVDALGWHWIGRVRHRTYVRLAASAARENAWISGKTLHPYATHIARSLGVADLTRSNPITCRLVLMRCRKRGRVERTRYGTRARGGHSRKMATRAKEPWLLAASCSLNTLTPAEIVRLYARRMQIEQAFRDLKSHRFGCAFEDTLTRLPRRLELLLLIHALASLVAWLAGVVTASQPITSQSKTKCTRHHSIIWLGWETLRRSQAQLSLPLAVATRQLRALLAHPL